MFQEALQFNNVIILCYNKQNTIKINRRMRPLLRFIFFFKERTKGLGSSRWTLVVLKESQ
jgi:hypothetical protein